MLKFEFLSSSPAADTEIRSENKCEEMAFQEQVKIEKKMEPGVL